MSCLLASHVSLLARHLSTDTPLFSLVVTERIFLSIFVKRPPFNFQCFGYRVSAFARGSHRPRARVPSVVWAWDFFVMRLPCCGLPAPALPLLFALRSATVCQQTDAFLCCACPLCAARVYAIHPLCLLAAYLQKRHLFRYETTTGFALQKSSVPTGTAGPDE